MSIFTAELVKPAMLLSRGLSFYLLLIMSALVTFVAHFIVMRNDKKNGLEGSQEVKKKSKKNERKRKMIGFYNYSVILTYIGLVSSVFRITQVFENHMSIAFLCLLLSGICDLLTAR